MYARANLVSARGGESGQARLCRAWLDFELRRGDPVTYAAADARAGVVLRRLEAEDRTRKLEGPDPEEAKRLRRANDPNYKGPGDGKDRKRKANEVNAGEDDAGEDDAASKRARTDADGEEKERRGGGLGADPAERAAKYKEIFPDRDRKTAFVKNLPFKCSEDELAAWFDARGGTVTARIVRDKATGRSRGFAYVEFTEEGAVQAAIMRDGEEFQSRALSIARSMPPGENQASMRERREKAGGAPHRRVGGAGPAGGAARGGLGFAGGMKPRAVAIGGGMTPRAAKTKPAANAAPKSNADFKAMFFQKGTNLEEGK